MKQKHLRVMAFDVGTKTCGIAVTDEAGIIVQPLTTLKYKGIHSVGIILKELLKIIIDYNPKIIVAGLPYNMDDSEGPQAKKVKEFISALKNYLKKNKHDPNQYKWDFMDERCTSEEAENFLLQHDVSRKKRKQVIDKMAAVFILQRYLDENLVY